MGSRQTKSRGNGWIARLLMAVLTLGCTKKECPPEAYSLKQTTLSKIPYTGSDSIAFEVTSGSKSDTLIFTGSPATSFSALDYRNSGSCRIEMRQSVKEYKLYNHDSSLLMRVSPISTKDRDLLRIYFKGKQFTASTDTLPSSGSFVLKQIIGKDTSQLEYSIDKGILRFDLRSPNQIWRRL